MLGELKNDRESLKKLILNTSYEGNTALLVALENGRRKIVEILLEYINDLNESSVMRDSQILTIYRCAQRDPDVILNQLIAFIPIENHSSKIKGEKILLDRAIDTKDNAELRTSLERSREYIRELMLTTNARGMTSLNLRKSVRSR